ncbi:MAG: hypothetical protein IPN68_04660 [Bacteroidetes bacterium]|nr:hypothetical protein [Bacteroidota bacterium]
MTNRKFQYSFNDLDVKISDVESLLGYNETSEREMIQSLIEEAIQEAAGYCSIRAEYRIFKNVILDDRNKAIFINDVKFDVQKIIFNQMKKSESMAVYVSTAGAGIGERSREIMMGGDPLKGYILDIIGSLTVDAASDLMQSDLAASLGQSGIKITNRFSPGHCGWSVADQHKLFMLMPDNFCGISLTGSALMEPIKSTSGFIGIGEHVKYNNYICSYCDMKECAYRELKDRNQ